MNNRGIPRKLGLGQLRHRCTVQAPVTSTQATGQAKVTSWSNVFENEPCRFEATAGTESMRGRQLEANTVALFVVNYRSGYDTRQRILFNGTYYGITHINDVDGMQRYLELVCRSA